MEELENKCIVSLPSSSIYQDERISINKEPVPGLQRNLQDLCENTGKEPNVSERKRESNQNSSFKEIDCLLQKGTVRQYAVSGSELAQAILKLVQEITEWIPWFQGVSEVEKTEKLIQKKFTEIGLILNELEKSELSLGMYSKEIREILWDIRKDIDSYEMHEFYANQSIMEVFTQLEWACEKLDPDRHIINKSKPGQAIFQAVQEISKLMPALSENSEARAVQDKFKFINALLDALKERKLGLGNHEEGILNILLGIREAICTHSVYDQFKNDQDIMNTLTKLEQVCEQEKLKHQKADKPEIQKLTSPLRRLGNFSSPPPFRSLAEPEEYAQKNKL